MRGLVGGGNIEEVQISEGRGAHSVLAVEFEAIISYHPYLVSTILFFFFFF